LDVARARFQQHAYAKALVSLGLLVSRFPPDSQFPDGCFIEDTLVYAKGIGVLTRSAHPARRGEGTALLDGYRSAGMRLVHMEAPATLDGGDVLRVGNVLLVGLTARTNRAGVQALRTVFGPVGVEVRPVVMPPDILHLKCVVSSPAPDTVLLAAETLSPEVFSSWRVLVIPAAERYAANTVGVLGRVLVADGFPATRDVLESAGLQTIPIDTSEFRKADGSLTCLSVIV
jgi:dimethylargininase